ncbi:GyrI-like domain-containing protein [Enterococcus sp. 5H]|uniref:GyrI-like domain-containing protein n=1 Tax=Enterococcus sp. 5H TaxID=1229490 RepID=UPI00230446F8|nr:effector binding domain-containing protein [Enterococcus sp. 5H]MDA9470037.1 hypothetical protein [Enterococcus sp. 5H]
MMTQLTEKIIKGKKIRTNNGKIDEIIQLWSHVPEMKLSGEVYAVYSNYASNFKGDYDLLIGNEHANFQESSTIQVGNYVEITVVDGTPENVGKAWQGIWGDAELESRRSYLTDFEYYKTDGSVSIYLSVN